MAAVERRLFLDFVLHQDAFSVLIYFNVRLPQAHHSHNTGQEISFLSFPPPLVFNTIYFSFSSFLPSFFFSFLHTHTHTHDDRNLSTLFPSLDRVPPTRPPDLSLPMTLRSIDWVPRGWARAQMILCVHSDPLLFF